jgi:hypothetical protein
MKSPTSNSSNNYIPGSQEELRRFKWQREQRQRDRQQAWDTMNAYVHSKGAWIVSLPGDNRDVVMECLPDSDLPAQLEKRGYELERGPDGERIIPALRQELVLVEGSTRSTVRTLREGIVTVKRYSFSL